MYTVEGFLEVYKVDVQRGVPLKALLDYVSQAKDLVCAPSSTSE